jgi:flavin-dependent dehydrogenase
MHVFFSGATRPGYGWVFPIDEHRANVGLGLLHGGGGQLAPLFHRFLRDPASPARPLLGDAPEIDGERTWPLALGWTTRRRAGGRALLAGDAASLIGPLTGAGIHSALRSGLMAAAAAGRALAEPDRRGAHLRAYERACLRRFRPPLDLERLGQRVVASRHGVDVLVAALSRSARLDALWTRVMFSLG